MRNTLQVSAHVTCVCTLFLHSHIHQLKTLHYLYVVHIIHFLWCGMGKMVEYSPWHVCTALSCIDPHSVALAHALYSVRGADPWINECAHALTLYMCVCVCVSISIYSHIPIGHNTLAEHMNCISCDEERQWQVVLLYSMCINCSVRNCTYICMYLWVKNC